MAGTTRDVTAVVKLDGRLSRTAAPVPSARSRDEASPELFDRECPAGTRSANAVVITIPYLF